MWNHRSRFSRIYIVFFFFRNLRIVQNVIVMTSTGNNPLLWNHAKHFHTRAQQPAQLMRINSLLLSISSHLKSISRLFPFYHYVQLLKKCRHYYNTGNFFRQSSLYLRFIFIAYKICLCLVTLMTVTIFNN